MPIFCKKVHILLPYLHNLPTLRQQVTSIFQLNIDTKKEETRIKFANLPRKEITFYLLINNNLRKLRYSLEIKKYVWEMQGWIATSIYTFLRQINKYFAHSENKGFLRNFSAQSGLITSFMEFMRKLFLLRFVFSILVNNATADCTLVRIVLLIVPYKKWTRMRPPLINYRTSALSWNEDPN